MADQEFTVNDLIENPLKGWDLGRGMQTWVQTGAGFTGSGFLNGELSEPGQGVERATPASEGRQAVLAGSAWEAGDPVCCGCVCCRVAARGQYLLTQSSAGHTYGYEALGDRVLSFLSEQSEATGEHEISGSLSSV